MTKERKEQIVAGLKLLFFPITGFYFVCKECKCLRPEDFIDFMTEWFHYVMGVILWVSFMFGIVLVTCGLIYHFNTTIIPVSIVGGGIFVFFILPYIIHKLIHRK